MAEERPPCPPPTVVVVVEKEPAAEEKRAEEMSPEDEAAEEAALWARTMAEFESGQPGTAWAMEAQQILSVEVARAVAELGGQVMQFECREKQCRAQLRWPSAGGSASHGLMNVEFSYNCARSSHAPQDADTSTFLFDCNEEGPRRSPRARRVRPIPRR